MKILITGGAGFIGSNLANFYLSKNYEVAILDNFSSGNCDFLHPQIKIFKADVCDDTQVAEVFQNFHPTIVSHHAGHISVQNSLVNPLFDAEQNILGSINVFFNAVKFGTKNVVLASTGGAMIPSDNTIFPTAEFKNPEPESPYAVSKFCAEKYLRYFAKKSEICATIFRYANVYGPHQTPKSECGVVAIFCEQLVKGKIPTIFGNGNQTRDFIFVEDICTAHWEATKNNIAGTFHLGTGTETTINELYTEIAKLCGIKSLANYDNAKPSELSRSALDATKFKKISNWQPNKSLIHGLQKTIDWAKIISI